MAKDSIKGLASAICELNFLDIKDLEKMIAIYFHLWQSEATKQEMYSSEIIKRRCAILSKRNRIEAEKITVEQQVLAAKSKLREGGKVDTQWLSRANKALRIKKMQIRIFQDELGTLTMIDKNTRTLENNTIERLMNDQYRSLLTKLLGPEEAKKITQEAARKAKEIKGRTDDKLKVE